MLKITALSLLLLTAAFPVARAAEPEGGIAKIIVASPSTTFEGNKVVDNATLGTLGTLKTGRDGGAKLKFIGNDVVLDISTDSEIKLIRPAVGEPNEVIELVSGTVRARVEPLKTPTKERAGRPVFSIRTKTSTMGVRGTDFLAIATPILSESEIIVFGGKVDFTSATEANDTKLVPAGYWGGIGGRFGKKTHELIKLPTSALDHYNKISKDTAHYTLEKQSTPPTNQSESSH